MKTSSAKTRLLRALRAIPIYLLVYALGILIYSRVTAPPTPQIPAPLPLPSPNGFDFYIAAAQALILANPPVDSVNDAQRLTPQQAAMQYSPQRRRAWIAENSAAWQKMAQAQTLQCRTPNMRGSTTTFAGWAQLRQLSFGQYIRSKDAKSTGQWGEATELGLDNLEMGLNIERGSDLVGSLVGIAIQAISYHSLEDIPPHLSGAQAKAATKRMESLQDNTQPFSEALTEEKWNRLSALNQYAQSGGKSGFELIGSIFLPQALGSLAQMMDDFIAEADKPFRAQKPIEPPTGIGGFYVGFYFQPTKDTLISNARRQTNQRLLLTRLALRAYRAEHSSYPTQLSQLAPTYLKSIPIDPFGKGEPLRYSVQGGSYTLWSIGPDGVDNSGVSIQSKSPGKRPFATIDSKGDIVAHP